MTNPQTTTAAWPTCLDCGSTRLWPSGRCMGGCAGELVEVGQTKHGYTLWREDNRAGGHRYWCNSIDGGVIVWDTCLASRDELETAMRIEREFERGER
jgi:hypothetical protein